MKSVNISLDNIPPSAIKEIAEAICNGSPIGADDVIALGTLMKELEVHTGTIFLLDGIRLVRHEA